jgi:hypothetical protein
MKQIEDTIFDDGIAVNSIVALRRMLDILEEHNTNCIYTESVKRDPRMRRLFWFLNAQMFGQLATIDMVELWRELKMEFDRERKGTG